MLISREPFNRTAQKRLLIGIHSNNVLSSHASNYPNHSQTMRVETGSPDTRRVNWANDWVLGQRTTMVKVVSCKSFSEIKHGFHLKFLAKAACCPIWLGVQNMKTNKWNKHFGICNASKLYPAFHLTLPSSSNSLWNLTWSISKKDWN